MRIELNWTPRMAPETQSGPSPSLTTQSWSAYHPSQCRVCPSIEFGFFFGFWFGMPPHSSVTGKVVFICLRVSANLVYRFQGKPGTTTVKHDFNPNGLKFHRGSPWVSVLSWLNLKANKDYFPYEASNSITAETHTSLSLSQQSWDRISRSQSNQ